MPKIRMFIQNSFNPIVELESWETSGEKARSANKLLPLDAVSNAVKALLASHSVPKE
jgi:hypothetical protein